MSLGFKGFRDEDADERNSRMDTMLYALAGCEDYGLFTDKQLAIIRMAVELQTKYGKEAVTINYNKTPGKKNGDVCFAWTIRFEKEMEGE